MSNIEPLARLASVASSLNAARAFALVHGYTGATNLPVWAGARLCDSDAVASHMLALGVRGLPTPGRTRGRADNPFWYIHEAVGGRRNTPIPVTEAEALRMILALNNAATDHCPAPDLLALTGWSALKAQGYDVRAAVQSRRASTYRLWDVREKFLCQSIRVAA